MKMKDKGMCKCGQVAKFKFKRSKQVVCRDCFKAWQRRKAAQMQQQAPK